MLSLTTTLAVTGQVIFSGLPTFSWKTPLADVDVTVAICNPHFWSEIQLLLLSCAKSHMLSASRRQPHLLHVSAVDRRQTWSMDKSWRCVTSWHVWNSMTIVNIDNKVIENWMSVISCYYVWHYISSDVCHKTYVKMYECRRAGSETWRRRVPEHNITINVHFNTV